VADPVRYFFDQHVDPAVAAGLRRLGIDVLTAQDAGRCGLDDPDQLAFATAEGRVVVTFDSDYIALHAAGTSHAGIAWAPHGKHAIGYLVGALEILHGVYTADDMRNNLEYL
jgi:hypothetical protein